MIGYRCCTKFQSSQELVNSYTAIVGGSIVKTSFSNYFQASTEFNDTVIIGDNVADCIGMFQLSSNFNSPVHIGNNVVNCQYMFDRCSDYNQVTIIPKNVMNCYDMFDGCYNMGSNIYINGTPNNIVYLVKDKNTAKRINIMCNNLTNLRITNSYNSITGTDITWTSMTNGYYNSAYNIYLYKNYVGT